MSAQWPSPWPPWLWPWAMAMATLATLGSGMAGGANWGLSVGLAIPTIPAMPGIPQPPMGPKVLGIEVPNTPGAKMRKTALGALELSI